MPAMAEGLRAYLRRHVAVWCGNGRLFEGDNYFRNPTLIEFIAENPFGAAACPKISSRFANVLVNAGADRFAWRPTWASCAGRICARNAACRFVIDFLCARGTQPDWALQRASSATESLPRTEASSPAEPAHIGPYGSPRARGSISCACPPDASR